MKNAIIYSSSHDPWFNLALETRLFDTLANEGLVLYLWQNENTVVIGRNQNAWAECDTAAIERDGVYLARRTTGGGAVFHDLGNLCFSFIAPEALYDLSELAEIISGAVRSFGIEVGISGRNDILAEGRKFSGGAFTARDDKRLYHGTLMVNVDVDRLSHYLTVDERKLKLKGIRSVRSRVVNLSELNPELTTESLAAALAKCFTDIYGDIAVCETVGDERIEKDAELRELYRLYSSWDYRYGMALPFDFCADERFAWGGVRIELELKHGVVAGCRVWTDAMEPELATMLSEVLKGCRFRKEELAAAVSTLSGRLAEGWIEDITAMLLV